MAGTSVGRAADQIRRMMRNQELLPGQPLRQEALAEQLGVSRVPVREALKSLEAEGVVRHRPNVGYTVTRLSADELQQSYLMRAALESTVLRRVPQLTDAQLFELHELNERIETASEAADVSRMTELSHDFHFAVFRTSGLDLIVDEIERIWRMTEPYRAVHLYDQAVRRKLVREHRMLIDALRNGELAAAISILDSHRHSASGAEVVVPAG
ncbi:GntR family transcriptional regulator [Saccharopolyspora rhizosphaerae]|uniref:GntR family transcriptional regulator n=1 Tax=Saccharopolyspora rhizosphaerae TaxID=2492662 RepID=A0A3R8P9V0_9PSEU|nr:GntR family transcriptional regulator [Saccharopolyspora rhizosphaerae]RRO19871.1 GntR family transcriptional regulator [Saccharopolyspora rhizosphaerae]